MSAAKAGKRPLRSLTAHEKLSAIKRVSVGGESKASVARDIGVPESTLRGWCKNQEKISYQVRTSPSNLEEASENLNLSPVKRIKLDDQPYNLSMKSSDVSNGSYSPNSESNFECEYPKTTELESDSSPLNLRTTKISEAQITCTPKITNNNTSVSEKDRQEKEREKNRAELARLSAELGLNRPEVLMSTLNGSSNLNDLTTALLQWKSVYQSWYYQQQQKALQQQPKVKTTVPLDTVNKIMSPTNGLPSGLPQNNGGLLTTVDKRDKLPNIEQQPSVYDSVSYWLRQQSLLNLSNAQQTQQPVLPTMSSCISTPPVVTSSTSAVTSTTAPLPATSLGDLTASQAANQQLRLWNWYQQSYSASQLQALQPVVQPEVPAAPVLSSLQQPQILYQQLTKETSDKDVNSENEAVKDEKPKNFNKNRSVLDNLLLNNNTIECDVKKEEQDDGVDAHEAIEHGEKFLNWLEHCSDPSVTTLQLHTVQSLIKNLKSGFDRKGDQNRNKVRRK